MLAFNERVLAMATRASVPLAERLRYICIVSSILDEFFEVRMADLSEEIRETRGASPLAPVYIIADSPATLSPAPRRSSPPALDDGPHLNYAIQWFAFAGIAFGGAAALWWSRRRSAPPIP